MKTVVVDTNVLVVANQKAEQATPDCILACVSTLEKIKQKRITLLDSGMRIIEEYRRYANLSGQPGLGDSFIKWLWNNQAHPKHCRFVDITPKPDDPDDFEEFPNDSALAGFDRSDRKFVAVARVCQCDPVILNATDSDWWIFREQLENHGLRIDFLCAELFRD